ncbi:MAG: hypothetical protein HC805_02965 [Alkalinema sp. RL_2_19]|nr:hypothetical protein [Alkalinema sp. RL_2_19]
MKLIPINTIWPAAWPKRSPIGQQCLCGLAIVMLILGLGQTPAWAEAANYSTNSITIVMALAKSTWAAKLLKSWDIGEPIG